MNQIDPKKKIRVKILTPIRIGGEHIAVGSEVTVDASLASSLIATEAAVIATKTTKGA